MERNPLDPEFMKVPPHTIFDFRNIPPSEMLTIPELSKNRNCTNVWFLLAFAVFFSLLVGCSAYIVSTKSLRKLLNGYDSCGNICGVNNFEIEEKIANCKPKDYTNFPVLFYSSEETSECIKLEDCRPPDRELFFRRCFSNRTSKLIDEIKESHEIIHTIIKSAIPMIVMISFATGLTILMYICLQIRAYITYFALVLMAVILTAITAIVTWYIFLVYGGGKVLLLPMISSVIYLGVIIIILLFLSNRFSLISRLYAEATHAIFQAPILLVQPLLTILFVFTLDGMVVYMFLLMFLPEEDGNTYYAKVRPAYIFLLVFMLYWLFGIANGCQCMIVTGVVGAHFFTQEGQKPRCSYLKSIWVTIVFHLGTIAAGALVITILGILKPFLERLNPRHHNCILAAIEKACTELREIAEYLSRKSYIMTALHGRGIYVSGQRSLRLLCLYFCDTIYIDKLSCVSMHTISLSFVFYSMLVGLGTMKAMDIQSAYTPLLLGMYCAGTVTFFYISLMTVVIETLLVCFCEDRLLHTGSRYDPYAMNPKLFSVMIEALDLSYRETHPFDNID